jgi:hypothetical protein
MLSFERNGSTVEFELTLDAYRAVVIGP